MKRLERLFFIPLALILTYCAPNKTEPLYFTDGIVNLEGMWVANEEAQTQFDILLGVDLNQGSTDINILGHKVKDYRMASKGNQFLLSYETIDGRKFNVLAQMKNKDEMRITRTEEALNDFMPIGQLGEKVFRLKRLSSKEQIVMASTMNKKKSNL